MIRHYLTFAHQAHALGHALAGRVLAECWSQEKNLLLLRFIRERDSVFVEAALDSQIGFALLREEVYRARRNTIDFFGSLVGVQVRDVTIDEGERIIRMNFVDGRTLAFFFFGGGGGNVLQLDAEGVEASFMKYSGEYDALLAPDHDAPPLEPELLRTALQVSEEQPLRALMHAVPNLGRRLALEALDRAGLKNLPSLADASEGALDRLLETLDVLLGSCEASTTFYIYHLPGEAVFTLAPLATLEREATHVERYDAIGPAIRAFRTAWHERRALAAVRDRVTKRLAGEHARLERALANRLDSASHTGRADEWELYGRLLTAHLHEIEKGSARLRMVDWGGTEREIALDTKLSPHENAERYFRRARGAREAAARAAAGIEKNRAMLARIDELQARAEAARTRNELEALEKNNKDLFGMTGEAKDPGTAERFRRFEVAGGYEVYAGKNAANNDELTVRFARPNDYWFHARGTSGSHVVLRWNDSKTKPPRETLRQAASIAAYYSGARGAKMVPVAYTLKKHVRKPRGAAPGSVVMEREEVVMAEPKLPSGSEE